MSDDQVGSETRRRGGDLAYGQVPPFSQSGTGLGDKQPLHSYLVLWAMVSTVTSPTKYVNRVKPILTYNLYPSCTMSNRRQRSSTVACPLPAVIPQVAINSLE